MPPFAASVPQTRSFALSRSTTTPPLRYENRYLSDASLPSSSENSKPAKAANGFFAISKSASSPGAAARTLVEVRAARRAQPLAIVVAQRDQRDLRNSRRRRADTCRRRGSSGSTSNSSSSMSLRRRRTSPPMRKYPSISPMRENSASSKQRAHAVFAFASAVPVTRNASPVLVTSICHDTGPSNV